MSNKKITFYEEGSNKTVELYPKTTIDQVEGLEEALVGSEAPVVKNQYDFGSAEILPTGTYVIKEPINSPFGNNEDGVLKVVSIGEDSFIQTWDSKNLSAYRFLGEVNPIETGISHLFVNNTFIDTSVSGSTSVAGVSVDKNATIVDKLDTGAEVVLEAGKIYTLSGALINTRIRITGGSAATTTNLILDGLYVLFNNKIDLEDEENLEKRVKGWEPMIYFDSEGKLAVTLADGSSNYLIREREATMPEPDENGLYGLNHKTAVIFSDNGGEILEIKGTGYLSIKSMLGGHAIKAKGSLVLNDSPKIRATCYHDVLHGNGSVIVNGGYIYCDWCNDFFGADTADGDHSIGKIVVKSGDFHIKYCKETFLQCDNAEIYPAMKLTFEHIGEGLWLQCKPGTRLFVEDGKIKGFFTLDYTAHTFVYNELKKKGMLDVAGWGKEEFWTPLEFAAHSDPYAALLSIPENNKKRIVTTINNVNGIVLYNGVNAKISGPALGEHYIESDRNTSRATAAANEVSPVPASDVSAMPVLSNYDQVFPVDEIVSFNQTITGGNWNLTIKREELDAEKLAISKSINAVLSTVNPPKTIVPSVKIGNTLVEEDRNGVKFIAPTDNYHGVKTAGKDVFTSKTGNVPVITLRKGEWARIYANLDPIDATNGALKWAIAGKNENTVIYIRKSDDTKYCDVVGIDNGTSEGQSESVIITAKALDKNGAVVKMEISFHVVPKEDGYKLVDLPEEGASKGLYETKAFDYIYDEASWNESFNNGVLHQYYAKYPDEDRYNTQAHRWATAADKVNGQWPSYCVQCWEGAVSAPGAKYPWICPSFTTEEPAKIIFRYEGKTDVKPWSNTLFGAGKKSWGIASVAEEFNDSSFLIPAHAGNATSSMTAGGEAFDISKFKVILEPYTANANVSLTFPQCSAVNDGNYHLEARVVNGVVTYTWVL